MGVREIPRIYLTFSRIVLVGLFLVITMLQLFSFPGQFRFEASQTGGSQVTRWVLTLVVALWFAFAQVAIVALWQIVTMIHSDSLLTARGVMRVNLLVRTFLFSGCFGGVITLAGALAADDPGPVVLLTAITALIFAIYVVSYFVRHQIFRGTPLI